MLDAVATDETLDVREALAGNPSTPARVLDTVTKSDDMRVRAGVTANPSAPADLPKALANDTDVRASRESTIRRSVAANPATPEALRIVEDFSAPEALRVSLLQILAREKDPYIRGQVALNSLTPASTLEMLASDNEINVRYGVAENTSTPANLLERLAKIRNFCSNERCRQSVCAGGSAHHAGER
jgi:hypothetical protein